MTQSGALVTVTNAGWNGSIGTGATTSLGFGGTWQGANPVPTDFALNGVACNGGATPTATPSTGVLDQVGSVGRLRQAGGGVQYTWPGTYFEGWFRGTGVGLALNDSNNEQIEFIGDSWTAGYGDMSTTRDCNSNGGVTRNSNADLSFGALTAKSPDADYQINAWSGLSCGPAMASAPR